MKKECCNSHSFIAMSTITKLFTMQTDNAEASMAISYIIAAVRQPLFWVAFAFALLYAFTPGVRPELLDNYREIIESS